MIKALFLRLDPISMLSLQEIYLLDLTDWGLLDATMRISQPIANMRANEELHSLQGLI